MVTGIDDHSRFCVCARVVARPTARPVCDPLELALAGHGVPDEILGDKGKVFTNPFGSGRMVGRGLRGVRETRVASPAA